MSEIEKLGEKLGEILRKSENIRKVDSWLYWMLSIIITLLICNLVVLIFIFLKPLTLEIIIG